MKTIKPNESYEISAAEVDGITDWMNSFNAFMKKAADSPPATPISKILESPEYGALLAAGLKVAAVVLLSSLADLLDAV